jgi:hypothetical protein
VFERAAEAGVHLDSSRVVGHSAIPEFPFQATGPLSPRPAALLDGYDPRQPAKPLPPSEPPRTAEGYLITFENPVNSPWAKPEEEG